MIRTATTKIISYSFNQEVNEPVQTFTTTKREEITTAYMDILAVKN